MDGIRLHKPYLWYGDYKHDQWNMLLAYEKKNKQLWHDDMACDLLESDHNHTTNLLIWHWMRLILANIGGRWYLLHLEFRILAIVAMNMKKCWFLLILLKQCNYVF